MNAIAAPLSVLPAQRGWHGRRRTRQSARCSGPESPGVRDGVTLCPAKSAFPPATSTHTELATQCRVSLANHWLPAIESSGRICSETRSAPSPQHKHRAMIAVVTWIVGIVVCGILGSIVSYWTVFPNYGSAVGVWGFIAGALAFACVRLGLATWRENSN
jgi:hypothetical protein